MSDEKVTELIQVENKVLIFDLDNFSVCINDDTVSEFDQLLQSTWNSAMEAGFFNYKTGNLQTKILPKKYSFVVQLNIKRATERRKPLPFSKVCEPFNENTFNFTKINKNEVLFELLPKHWHHFENSTDQFSSSAQLKHFVVINVSPLEYCHSLLLPYKDKKCPQVLTFDSLRLAVETMLLSNTYTFRIGFNSLGGFASVNHLHFHLYYLQEHLYLETAVVSHLAGECYEILHYPAKCFVFQVVDRNVAFIISDIMKLISFLLENNIAYNVFITRGRKLCDETKLKPDVQVNKYEAIRIFVWARYFYYGAKDDFSFNPAVCELAGHIPVKSMKFYEEVTEEDVVSVIQSACCDTFEKVCDDVRKLFL